MSLAFELSVYLSPVRNRSALCQLCRRRRVENGLELLVIEIVRKRPADPSPLGASQKLVEGGLAGADARSDLSVAEPRRLQPQGFFDLAHGKPLSRHSVLPFDACGGSRQGGGPFFVDEALPSRVRVSQVS